MPAPTDQTPDAQDTPDTVIGFCRYRHQYGAAVVLVRKTRPDAMRGFLNGIGGHIKSGEHPRQAMAREWREETGTACDESDWTHRVTLKRARSLLHVFARDVSGWFDLPERAPDYEPVVWANARDLGYYNVWPNLHWLIPLAFDSHVEGPLLVPYLLDAAEILNSAQGARD